MRKWMGLAVMSAAMVFVSSGANVQVFAQAPKKEKDTKIARQIQADRRVMHRMDRRAFTLLDGFEDIEG